MVVVFGVVIVLYPMVFHPEVETPIVNPIEAPAAGPANGP